MSITPAQIPLVPKMKRDLMISLLREARRIDDRKPEELRRIDIFTNYLERANGSALVKLGDTVVLTGVKIELGTPFPDTPDEGVLVVSAEFVPVASPFFEPGPPDENATELARVIDRSLRESKALDLKSLAVIPGSRVLSVWCDVYVLSHAGNLVDAASIATIAALATTKLPRVEVQGNVVKLVREVLERELKLNRLVVTATVAKIGDFFVVDPTDEEEAVADVRLAVSFDRDGVIVGMQKMGCGSLSLSELETAVELAWRSAQKYFDRLEAALKSASSASVQTN